MGFFVSGRLSGGKPQGLPCEFLTYILRIGAGADETSDNPFP